MDKPLENSSIQDIKTSVDCHTKCTIKKLTRKNKNKGLLQLSVIVYTSNSTILAKKGCCKDDRLHGEEQTGTTTAQERQRGILKARECKTQVALKPSLKTILKPEPR